MISEKAFIPKGDEEGQYSDEFRIGLLEVHFEAKKGKLIPFEALRKEILQSK